MDNINKNKEENKLDKNSDLLYLINHNYKFNKAACGCLIAFIFIFSNFTNFAKN